MKQNYTVIFDNGGNVSFSASSHAGIMRTVRTIARQIGRMRSHWQVIQMGRLITSGGPLENN